MVVATAEVNVVVAAVLVRVAQQFVIAVAVGCCR